MASSQGNIETEWFIYFFMKNTDEMPVIDFTESSENTRQRRQALDEDIDAANADQVSEVRTTVLSHIVPGVYLTTDMQDEQVNGRGIFGCFCHWLYLTQWSLISSTFSLFPNLASEIGVAFQINFPIPVFTICSSISIDCRVIYTSIYFHGTLLVVTTGWYYRRLTAFHSFTWNWLEERYFYAIFLAFGFWGNWCGNPRQHVQRTGPRLHSQLRADGIDEPLFAAGHRPHARRCHETRHQNRRSAIAIRGPLWILPQLWVIFKIYSQKF